MKNIMITGAAGFIGANFVELMVKQYGDKYNYIVYDKLTYAGNIHNLDNVKDKIIFVQGDICDFDKVMETYQKYNIDGIVHFAAESHVDYSIKTPFIFTQTNVIGTHSIFGEKVAQTNLFMFLQMKFLVAQEKQDTLQKFRR